MTEKRTIKPEKLTDSNFKEFGAVVKKPERSFDFETPWLRYWHNTVDLSALEGAGQMGFMQMKRVPLICEKLLMLHRSIEMYLSLDGKPSIVFAAPGTVGSSAAPDLDRIHAFILEDGEGVIVNAGIWHWSPFPLTETANFALGLKDNIILQQGNEFSANENEILYFDIKPPIGIEL